MARQGGWTPIRVRRPCTGESTGQMDIDQVRAPLRRGNHRNPSLHDIPPMGGPLAIFFPTPGHKFSHRGEPLEKKSRRGGWTPIRVGHPCAGATTATRHCTVSSLGGGPINNSNLSPHNIPPQNFGSPVWMDTDQGRAPLRRGNHSNPSLHDNPPMGGPLAKIFREQVTNSPIYSIRRLLHVRRIQIVP